MKKNIPNAERLGARIRRDWIRNRSLYIMVIPVLLFYILFHYKPMYGTIMAFMVSLFVSRHLLFLHF